MSYGRPYRTLEGRTEGKLSRREREREGFYTNRRDTHHQRLCADQVGPQRDYPCHHLPGPSQTEPFQVNRTKHAGVPGHRLPVPPSGSCPSSPGVQSGACESLRSGAQYSLWSGAREPWPSETSDAGDGGAVGGEETLGGAGVGGQLAPALPPGGEQLPAGEQQHHLHEGRGKEEEERGFKTGASSHPIRAAKSRTQLLWRRY